MPRIRSLKIGLFHNEELCDLSPWHRLLFAGLPLIADKEGRLEDRPRRIKVELFPYDDLDIDVLLTDLARRGFVLRYVADGVAAIAIPNFLKHQRPNNKEAASVIPAPTCEQCGDRHEKDQGEWSLGSGLGNGLGKGEAADGAAGADGAPPKVLMTRAEDLMAAWNTTTQSARALSLAPLASTAPVAEVRSRGVAVVPVTHGEAEAALSGAVTRAHVAGVGGDFCPDSGVHVLPGRQRPEMDRVVRLGRGVARCGGQGARGEVRQPWAGDCAGHRQTQRGAHP